MDIKDTQQRPEVEKLVPPSSKPSQPAIQSPSIGWENIESLRAGLNRTRIEYHLHHYSEAEVAVRTVVDSLEMQMSKPVSDSSTEPAEVSLLLRLGSKIEGE
jgi:hypothetical protein